MASFQCTTLMFHFLSHSVWCAVGFCSPSLLSPLCSNDPLTAAVSANYINYPRKHQIPRMIPFVPILGMAGVPRDMEDKYWTPEQRERKHDTEEEWVSTHIDVVGILLIST